MVAKLPLCNRSRRWLTGGRWRYCKPRPSGTTGAGKACGLVWGRNSTASTYHGSLIMPHKTVETYDHSWSWICLRIQCWRLVSSWWRKRLCGCFPYCLGKGRQRRSAYQRFFRGTLKMSGRLCWTAWATPIKTSAANSTTTDWEWEFSYWPHPAGCN